jgi:hypothetical protein
MGLPSYDPWSPELAELHRLRELQDWAALRRRALEVIDNWMLTPFIHECVALSSQKLGDEDRAQLEMELFAACAQGILMTGDGSADFPYLTVRIDDAYGALVHLEVEWTRERSATRHGVACHVLTGPDGREYWFDLSLAAAAKQSLLT